MEIRIGVVYTPKELVVELDDGKDVAKGAVETIERALAEDQPLIWFTDSKGRRIGVPADKLAYVEISTDDSHQRVGFGR